MGISISGTTLTFNDSTTMTTAATATSTSLDGIGTYALVLNASNSDISIGSTVAGSSLRYSFSGNTGTQVSSQNGSNPTTSTGRFRINSSGYDGGGSSLSGTWRKMSNGSNYTVFSGCCTQYNWWCNLYVRIS